MKLTFTKYFGPAQDADVMVMPCTMDGELLENVVSCKIESQAERPTLMHLTVHADERFHNVVARRLKGGSTGNQKTNTTP